MKWLMITVVTFAGLGHTVCQAEPVGVSLEWIELDCTKCPELAARFQPKQDYAAFVERRDPKFADLEKKAAKRVLVHHVEWLEPGTKVKHTTQINNESTFDLDLAITPTKKGDYEAVLRAELRQGAEWDASVGPGTQPTPAQMKGVEVSSTMFKLVLSPGQSWVTDALFEKRHQTKGNLLDGLAIFGAKKDDGPVLRVFIVGLRGPDAAKTGSRMGRAH